MDVPKKYWWIAAIVVPIVAAIITITPYFLKEKGITYVAGSQFTGNVAFNNITIVAEQARQMLGKELPDNVLETLREAFNFVQSRQFDKAIPLFQSAATIAPVSAVYNNLGAALLATGNQEKAKEYLEKARDIMPDEKTVSYNLNQIANVSEKEEVIEEAACYDESQYQALLASLQKVNEAYTNGLIGRNDSDIRRQKLVDDLDRLMKRGPTTESCILQQLEFLKLLRGNELITRNQVDNSRQALWRALHDLLLLGAHTESENYRALNVLKQLYDNELITRNQRDESREALRKKLFKK